MASDNYNENNSSVFIKVENCLDNDLENNDNAYIKMNLENSLDINERSNTQTEDINYINIKSEFNDIYDGVNVDYNTTNDNNKPMYNHVIIKEENNINDPVDASIMPEKTIKMHVDFPGAEFEEYDICNDGNNVYENRNIENIHKVFIKMEHTNVDLTQEAEEKISRHKCLICSFECKTFIALKIHEKIHNEKTFKCSQCFKKFKTNNELVEHKLQHTETSYKCPSCEAVFTNHCDCLIHQIEIHIDSLEYTCPECDITYNRKYLKGHVRNHFYNKTKCTICNEMVNKRYLKSHMNWHNSAYKCAECGHVSKEKRMYEYHMAIHTGVKIYQCYYCGEGFKHVSGRYRHMDVYHKPVEKLFECSICNKKFREKVVLTRHMATHDNKRLDCKYCEKKYKNETCLKLHLLKHENKQKYKCTVCGVKRCTSQSLRIHMLYKHSKERPYRCEVCNLTYKCPQDIEKHNASQMHKDRLFKKNVKVKTEE
ncbi:hypothetical protein K1T71_014691 [Dendrolimus kikuchii]|uniref:Uncharacterized protein n=1 Tax=Dendrolimus kikuchii TaxID=765133 RepID=A0ACC1CEQ9_9NEOP|nr:hypothetical protein K1T71_014691 [Dendrolimus kikuchii]